MRKVNEVNLTTYLNTAYSIRSVALDRTVLVVTRIEEPIMNKVIVPWKAYPLDGSGAKSTVCGQVEVMAEYVIINRLHAQVADQVRTLHPELQSTPIVIGRFHKEAA